MNGALLGVSVAGVVAFVVFMDELGATPLALGLAAFTVFLWRWTA